MSSTLELMQPRVVVSVTELTRDIKNILSENFTDVWVSGEISNLKKSANGHTYFTLKDQNAQVSAVFFKYAKQSSRFDLEEGMEVTAHGRLNVYEPRGQYQLVVDFAEPKGLGALMMALEQLKKKLTLEGIFAEDNKIPLPVLPHKVGLITSPQGAVVHDMITVMRRRFSSINIILYPVTVQGAGAAEQIALAIKEMDQLPDIDVIIVGRGGGSIEDLWAFNEEVLVRAVAACNKPIVSAVGHETDYTLCDLAADVRAPTPSVAGELVVPLKEELENDIAAIKAGLVRTTHDFIKNQTEKLVQYKRNIKDPLKIVDDYVLDLDQKTQRMLMVARHFLEVKKMGFENMKIRLMGLSPMAPLQKGYAIIYDASSEVVKNVKDLKSKNKYIVHMKDGTKGVVVE